MHSKLINHHPEILKESLTSTVVDIDKGTILDENNLISNEKA